MPAPRRTAVTGNSPGWRHRNRLQQAGSAQLSSLCTAEGLKSFAHQSQYLALLPRMWFFRVQGLQRGRSWGNVDGGGRNWRDPEGSGADMRGRRKGLPEGGHWTRGLGTPKHRERGS